MEKKKVLLGRAKLVLVNIVQTLMDGWMGGLRKKNNNKKL